jgi:hypothetical protein
LSPTHLHEFKSADKTQAPIMSLFLPEQKLGSHSSEGGSSNKFMLKGRQTGAMHRGHSWVFRAESRETMLAWYEDIKSLTEKSPQERNAFVRQHARSVSGTSQKAASIGGSSDGMIDEEDEEPFSAASSAVVATGPKQDVLPKRPEPGGRFPSDVNLSANRDLQAPLSPSSGSSGFEDRDVIAAAGALPGSNVGQRYAEESVSPPTHAAMVNQFAQQDGINPYTYQPIHNTQSQTYDSSEHAAAGLGAAGLGAMASGAIVSEAYHNQPEIREKDRPLDASMNPVSSTYAQESEALASKEAALVAAPDTQQDLSAPKALVPSGNNPDYMQGAGVVAASGLQAQLFPANPQNASNLIVSGQARPAVVQAPSHQSVQSVSQLHVPGEFPKGAPI